MDDLISRQAAIDAMNAKLEDIKLRWKGKVKKGEIAMYLDMRGTIETLPSAQPTVDAVPVIRCKDCKYASVGRNEVDSWRWCKVHHCDFEMDDYCSWAGQRGKKNEQTRASKDDESRRYDKR